MTVSYIRQTKTVSWNGRGRQYRSDLTLRIHEKNYAVIKQTGELFRVIDDLGTMRAIRRRTRGLRHQAKLLEIASISNPHVPVVFDHDTDQRFEYLVQDWVQGRTLCSYFKQARIPFEPGRSYRLARGLVIALEQLHRLNVHHGDISDTNVVVGNGERLILIDFGAAWYGSTPGQRRAESTWEYAAPEVRNNMPTIDRRSDQFAASALIYQMFTGKPPYLEHAEPGAADEPALIPPRRLNSAVWPSLNEVLVKALQLEQSSRYPTSKEWQRTFFQAAPRKSLFGRLLADFLS